MIIKWGVADSVSSLYAKISNQLLAPSTSYIFTVWITFSSNSLSNMLKYFIKNAGLDLMILII